MRLRNIVPPHADMVKLSIGKMTRGCWRRIPTVQNTGATTIPESKEVDTSSEELIDRTKNPE